MIQRECPMCKNGVMSELQTFRGWGREGFYVCDKCGHSKSIYENKTVGPYIFFIFIEILIFVLSDHSSFVEYFLYGSIFLILLYLFYRAMMRDLEIENSYPIIDIYKGEFTPNEIQKTVYEEFKTKGIKQGRKIKIIIALFITISYTIMFYYEENMDYLDYLGYFFIAVLLPLGLVFLKFEEEE